MMLTQKLAQVADAGTLTVATPTHINRRIVQVDVIVPTILEHDGEWYIILYYDEGTKSYSVERTPIAIFNRNQQTMRLDEPVQMKNLAIYLKNNTGAAMDAWVLYHVTEGPTGRYIREHEGM